MIPAQPNPDLKAYRVYWTSGGTSIITGTDFEDAMKRSGYATEAARQAIAMKHEGMHHEHWYNYHSAEPAWELLNPIGKSFNAIPLPSQEKLTSADYDPSTALDSFGFKYVHIGDYDTTKLSVIQHLLNKYLGNDSFAYMVGAISVSVGTERTARLSNPNVVAIYGMGEMLDVAEVKQYLDQGLATPA